MNEEIAQPQEAEDTSTTESSQVNEQSLLAQEPQVVESKEETQSQVRERPDYIPEDYWDTDKGEPKLEDAFKKMQEANEKADKLRKVLSNKKSFEEYKKAEGEQVESEGVPQEYKFDDVSPELMEKITEGELNLYTQAAKESGLNNEQAAKLLETYSSEIIEAQNQNRQAELEKLGPEGESLLGSLYEYGQGRVNAKMFSDEEFNAYQNMISTASNARILGKIIEMTGEKPIPVSVRANSDTQSLQDAKYELMDALRKGNRKETREVKEAREKLARLTQ